MTPDEINRAVGALDEAERTRTQIGLLSRTYPGMDMADAYAVQAAWVAKRKRMAGASSAARSA